MYDDSDDSDDDIDLHIEMSSAERVLMDLERARRGMGRDFGRNDPRARFFLQRAKVNAVLEIGKAVRGEGEGLRRGSS